MSQNNPAEPRKRGLAYIRISSFRQINGESPETQLNAIKQYVAANNIDIADTFFDEAKSGKNTDRDELQHMLEYVQKQRGKIDYVIVYKMNRASRDMDTYVMGFRMKLKALGVSIHSATEQIDDSPMGQFMEFFSVLVGQMDNQTKRDFTVHNMTALAQQGYWQHPPVLGYETHKIQNDVGKLRPTLKQTKAAPLVKQVLERFSQGDISKAELTRFAESIGLRSRYGKVLGEDSMNRMLKNPVYAGFVADKHTGGELVQGKHEAIISPDTFELNQTLLYGKKKRLGEVHQRLNPQFPLKGLLLCPHCKLPLYASAPRTGAGGKSPRYHCSRASCKSKYKSTRASVMHDDFKDLLKRIQPDDTVLELYRDVLVAESANQLGNLNIKISRVRDKLDAIADSRLTAIKRFNADQLSESDKNDLLASYDKDKAVLSEELSKLESQQLLREADIELAVSAMRDVATQWEVASPAAKLRFQSVLFPEGLVYDAENHRFGTTDMSPLYRCITTEKGTEVPLKSDLVAGPGLEPGTSWL